MDAKILSYTESPTVDEQPDKSSARLSFWQHSFVQNVLPLLVSLAIHLSILAAGVFAFAVVRVVNQVTKEQIFSPEAVVVDQPTVMPGPGNDPTRPAAQDKFDIPESSGLTDQRGKDLASTLTGGGSGDTTDGVLGVAKNGLGLGVGRSQGTGIGDSNGNGNGDGGLAIFGIPGGGIGKGPATIFPSNSNRNTKVVYVLDATGSMMSSFDNLRRQLKLSISGLRPPQSFNIIFINDRHPEPFAPQLRFASPEAKRQAEEYVDNMAPRGGTEPLDPIAKAYAMKPDVIHLLMDPTDIPDHKAMMDLITKCSAGGKTKLNMIAFEGEGDEETSRFLKEIARSSGGVYTFKKAKDLAD